MSDGERFLRILFNDMEMLCSAFNWSREEVRGEKKSVNCHNKPYPCCLSIPSPTLPHHTTIVINLQLKENFFGR